MRGSPSSCVPRSGQAEHGFTLIEVVVTMFVLTVGLLAIIDAVVESGRLTHGSQRQEQAVAYAQSRIEQIRSHQFDQIALRTTPAHEGNGNSRPEDVHPRNPNYYVSNGPPACFSLKGSYRNQNPAAGESCEGLIVDASSGLVEAGPTAFDANGTSGVVYQYVTAAPGGCVTIAGVNTCLDTSGTHFRRITVAVVLDPGAARLAPRKPIYVSSLVSDPETCPVALC